METDITGIPPSDPLGLNGLKTVIDRLREVLSNPRETAGVERVRPLIGQLDQACANTMDRYALLKDRYALLKRSNAALCDELVWLRDQLDDLSGGP